MSNRQMQREPPFGKSSLTRSEIEQAKNGRLLNFVAQLHAKRARGEAMRRSLSDISPVLTVRDLSNYLRVHPSTVYRLLKTGQLPAFKVGRDWRFNIEAIHHWRVEREKNLGMPATGFTAGSRTSLESRPSSRRRAPV